VCVTRALMGRLAAPAHASRRQIGALKLSSRRRSSSVDKGFFKEFGVDPELVFFQAAPIATALATGSSTSAPPADRGALQHRAGGRADVDRRRQGARVPGYPPRHRGPEGAVRLGSVDRDLKATHRHHTLGSTFHYTRPDPRESGSSCRRARSAAPTCRAVEALKGKQVTPFSCLSPSRHREAQGFGKISSGPGSHPCRSPPSSTRRNSRPTASAPSIHEGYVKASRYYTSRAWPEGRRPLTGQL